MSDRISIEWALLSALNQGGVEAVNYALERGLVPEDIGEKGTRVNRVFELMCEGAEAGELPSAAEIKISLGFKPQFSSEKFDLNKRLDAVLKASLRINLRDGIEELPDKIQDDPELVLEEIGALYDRLASKISRRPVMRSSSPKWIEEIEEEYERAKKLSEAGELIGLSSPWSIYDDVSLGLQVKQVTAIVAKTKMGKTYLALKWLQHIVDNDLKPGEKAFFVSPETGKEVINRRFVAIYEGLHEKMLQRGMLEDESEEKFYNFLKEWKDNPDSHPEIFWFYHDDVRSLKDLIRYAKQHKPRVIFIDAFYFLADALPDQYQRSPDHKKLQVLAEMIHRDLAQDCDLPVVVTHQLAGSKKGKWSLDFEADDLAGSKAIGRSVSALLALLATKDMRDEHTRLIRTLEARNFDVIDWKIYFDVDGMRFDQIGKWTEEDEEED